LKKRCHASSSNLIHIGQFVSSSMPLDSIPRFSGKLLCASLQAKPLPLISGVYELDLSFHTLTHKKMD
jgi:hypothetical protein